MNTDQLRQAAERVRRVNAGESRRDVYQCGNVSAACDMQRDQALLANDHPLVKGEPAAGGESERRMKLLGDALLAVLIKAGVLRAEAEVSGPELLCAANDYCSSPPSAPPADAVDWPTEPGFWIWDSPVGAIPVQASDSYGEVVVYRFAYDFRYEKGGMAGHGFRKLSLTAREGEKG